MLSVSLKRVHDSDSGFGLLLTPLDLKCKWIPSCGLHLSDTNPASIARHLVQNCSVSVTYNRTRALRAWSDYYSKHMYPSSFGKLIAEGELREPLYSCLHYEAKFARSGTLTRHIKSFCPALLPLTRTDGCQKGWSYNSRKRSSNIFFAC